MTPQSSRSATRLKIKLGVRKGQAGWLGYVSEFIAETKTSGLVWSVPACAEYRWYPSKGSKSIEGDQGRSVGDRHSQAAATAGRTATTGGSPYFAHR